MTVYDRYADAIYRHCYFRVFNSERARELMQEAFTKTWGEMVAGKKLDNPKAFVYRVVNNLIIDETRRKHESSLEALQATGFEPSKEEVTLSYDYLDGKRLLPILEELEATHREVIIMRYIDDLAPREIAEILGESTNVISVRLHRAVKEVRERIEQQKKNKKALTCGRGPDSDIGAIKQDSNI